MRSFSTTIGAPFTPTRALVRAIPMSNIESNRADRKGKPPDEPNVARPETLESRPGRAGNSIHVNEWLFPMSTENMTSEEALEAFGFAHEDSAKTHREAKARASTLIKCETETAVAFLCNLGQRERLDLFAICPETGVIEGGTFLPRNREQMRAWIEARQGKVGIYYSVNEGKTDKINVKPAKEDIGLIHCAFIDLDPSDFSQPHTLAGFLLPRGSANPRGARIKGL
jgi:hypothetical protein